MTSRLKHGHDGVAYSQTDMQILTLVLDRAAGLLPLDFRSIHRHARVCAEWDVWRGTFATRLFNFVESGHLVHEGGEFRPSDLYLASIQNERALDAVPR